MSALSDNAITRLATSGSIDMNTGTAQPLFLVPANRTCIVTHVVVRNASASITSAAYSFGYNSTAYNDVIVSGAHDGLTSSLKFVVIPAISGTTGVSGQVLNVKMNTLQGSAATTIMDVFGYLI